MTTHQTETATSQPAFNTTPIPALSTGRGLRLMSSEGMAGMGKHFLAPPNACAAFGLGYIVQISMAGLSVWGPGEKYLGTADLADVFRCGQHPLNGAYDVRIIWDRDRRMFVAAALERGRPRLSNNGIVVARATDPLGKWQTYYLPVGESGVVLDFLTLGADRFGYYFGAGTWPAGFPEGSAQNGARYIVADAFLKECWSFPEPGALAGSPVAPVGLYNGRSVFVSAADGGAALIVREVAWKFGPKAVPSMECWSVLPVVPAGGVDSLDIQAKGSSSIYIGNARIHSAVATSDAVYCARHVVAPSGDLAEVAVYKIGIGGRPLIDPPILANTWVVRCTDGTKRHYYLPALGMNLKRQVVCAMNGSSETEHVGAYLAWISPERAPVAIRAGQAGYTRMEGNRNRWGDFNSVALADDGRLWAVAEIAGPERNGWSVWAERVS